MNLKGCPGISLLEARVSSPCPREGGGVSGRRPHRWGPVTGVFQPRASSAFVVCLLVYHLQTPQSNHGILNLQEWLDLEYSITFVQESRFLLASLVLHPDFGSENHSSQAPGL